MSGMPVLGFFLDEVDWGAYRLISELGLCPHEVRAMPAATRANWLEFLDRLPPDVDGPAGTRVPRKPLPAPPGSTATTAEPSADYRLRVAGQILDAFQIPAPMRDHALAAVAERPVASTVGGLR